MPIQRKYDFKPGTKISSSQVDEEFDQLVAAINQVETDQQKEDTDIREKAQMTKITTDTGAARVNLTKETDNLLQELMKMGVGLHSFYAVNEVKDTPPNSGSIRGLFHQTSPGTGWVIAISYTNHLFSNFIAANVWTGWKEYRAMGDRQETLWTGAAFMGAAQTITPTKKISDCPNGWVLLWSDFEEGVGGRNWDFQTTVILKDQVSRFPGGSMTIPIAFYHDNNTVGMTAKTVYIHDDKIVGHAANDSWSNNSRDVCLRNVLEF